MRPFHACRQKRLFVVRQGVRGTEAAETVFCLKSKTTKMCNRAYRLPLFIYSVCLWLAEYVSICVSWHYHLLREIDEADCHKPKIFRSWRE